jgi:predicted MFS family arabinose efflux permease
MSSLHPDKFTPLERRASFSLASIFAFRMLGLFIVLPIFSLYAQHLSGATPFLIGLAMGVYGLTQALLQIPFGVLSDYYSRKKVIALGLIIFAAGSLTAALAHSITMLIIGRALQGTGAVGSATMALVADLTREQQRTKAMAIIGITIGFSFYLGMILGPFLNQWLSVPGIFGLTAGLGFLGLVILTIAVPSSPSAPQSARESITQQLQRVLQCPALSRLNLGILILHALLTVNFIVIPIALHNQLGLASQQLFYVYLPVLIAACILAIPLLIFAEKKQKERALLLGSIIVLLLTELMLFILPTSSFNIIANLILFFTGFTILEALLPSMASKAAPVAYRGTAMGVYSSAQFLGIFVGGALGGWLYGKYSLPGVFFAGTLMAGFWFLIAKKHTQNDWILGEAQSERTKECIRNT